MSDTLDNSTGAIDATPVAQLREHDWQPAKRVAGERCTHCGARRHTYQRAQERQSRYEYRRHGHYTWHDEVPACVEVQS